MQDGGSTERPALSLGSVEAHLYEIIQVCIKIYIFPPATWGPIPVIPVLAGSGVGGTDKRVMSSKSSLASQ